MTINRRSFLAMSGSGIALVGCAAPPLGSAVPGSSSSRYRAIIPFDAKFERKGKNSETLKTYPNETVLISTAKVEADGKLSFIPAAVSIAGQNYEVYLDYVKYRTDTAPSASSGLEPTYYYSGVGLRMTARIHARSGNLSLSNFFGIGLAAQANQVAGSLTTQTIGVGGPAITPLLPMPSELSVSSIQNAITGIAAIKAKLYDDATDIWPQVFAVEVAASVNTDAAATSVKSVVAR